MSMRPSDVHEALDNREQLAAARGPGCYALRLNTPELATTIEAAFLSHSEATPATSHMEQLADADRVAYVGASGTVYDRLQDHADGDVRQALFVECFELTDVIDIWPSETPFEDEYRRALYLSNLGWTVWCDGQVL